MILKRSQFFHIQNKYIIQLSPPASGIAMELLLGGCTYYYFLRNQLYASLSTHTPMHLYNVDVRFAFNYFHQVNSVAERVAHRINI
jgi:hypothetical protein